MRKTTRDPVPKPTVFTRKRVAIDICDENKVGSMSEKKTAREAALDILAKAKAREAAMAGDMVDIVIDDRTVVRVHRSKAESAEKLYKKRKS